MACASKRRSSTSCDTAAHDLKTQQESLVFVKRMVALAVSSITYLRGIFPEDAYRSRYLEDLCIKLLREESASRGASKIVKWLMGCFDALERGYLHIMLIGVHTNPEDPNHIIESYQFRFKYTSEGPQMDILGNNEEKITIKETKSASMLLVRKLFLLMQNLDVLPSDVCLTMKLYYYDNVTPLDYEPPGFKEGLCDRLWFEGTAVHFRVGDVHTPYHTLKVQVAAEENRVQNLMKGNHLRQPVHNSHEKEKKCKGEVREDSFQSQDDFKKPRKAPTKRRYMPRRLAKKSNRTSGL